MKYASNSSNGSTTVRVLGGAIILMFIVFYLMARWDAEEEVIRHQGRLIEALEGRKWKKIDALMAADFTDNAGHNKEWALREPREALRHFLTLNVAAKQPTYQIIYPREEGDPKKGTVSTWLHFEGNGTPFAHLIKDTANSTTDPFLFTWRKESWKPWDWKLVSISHPLLHQAP